jgi:hypothetical protein
MNFSLELQFPINIISGGWRIVRSEKLIPQLSESGRIHNNRIVLPNAIELF